MSKGLENNQFRINLFEIMGTPNSPNYVDKIIEKVANTLRRMGVNIIIEPEPVTDLSLVYTITLPNKEMN